MRQLTTGVTVPPVIIPAFMYLADFCENTPSAPKRGAERLRLKRAASYAGNWVMTV